MYSVYILGLLPSQQVPGPTEPRLDLTSSLMGCPPAPGGSSSLLLHVDTDAILSQLPDTLCGLSTSLVSYEMGLQ